MRFSRLSILAAVLGFGAVLSLGPRAPSQDPPNQPDQQEGVEVLAHGQVHEAYAEPTAARPEAAPVVSKEPPPPIAEEPPEQKPEGDDIEWMPGYWAWDDDASDYLWVSGFWREAPPGRNWVPGYWHQVENGWQWSSGFWASDDTEQVNYVPPPPEPVETGPSTPAPSADMSFVPGCWVWRQTRFLWRPGFWMEFRPGWVWVPAHYVWTPVGYVFVEGYWDYPLHDRGLLFAPCRFRPAFLTRRDFVFVPRFVVQPDFLISALFIRPRFGHYYFGDYFEPRYRDRGFVAWTDYRIGRNLLDANLSYYHHRFHDDAWVSNLNALYAARFRGDVPRPPRTLALQQTAINEITTKNVINNRVTNNINITNIQNVSVLAPLNKLNNTNVTALASLARADARPERATERQTIKLAAFQRDERQRVIQNTEKVRSVAQQRR